MPDLPARMSRSPRQKSRRLRHAPRGRFPNAWRSKSSGALREANRKRRVFFLFSGDGLFSNGSSEIAGLCDQGGYRLKPPLCDSRFSFTRRRSPRTAILLTPRRATAVARHVFSFVPRDSCHGPPEEARDIIRVVPSHEKGPFSPPCIDFHCDSGGCRSTRRMLGARTYTHDQVDDCQDGHTRRNCLPGFGI